LVEILKKFISNVFSISEFNFFNFHLIFFLNKTKLTFDL
jgi:hypothetical protein